MNRSTLLLFSVSLILFSLPGSLAGPACARRYSGDGTCVSRCAARWGIPGAVMGTDPWGSVMKPLVGPGGPAAVLAQACGSSTPESYVSPSSSGPPRVHLTSILYQQQDRTRCFVPRSHADCTGILLESRAQRCPCQLDAVAVQFDLVIIFELFRDLHLSDPITFDHANDLVHQFAATEPTVVVVVVSRACSNHRSLAAASARATNAEPIRQRCLRIFEFS